MSLKFKTKGWYIMKKMKRMLALCLTMCLIVAAMAGCGKKESASTDASSMEALTENTLPITTEDITLDVWVKNSSQGYATGYEDYKVIDEIEKRTGIKLNFIHPVGSAQEQLNIMKASGDLPDIIIYYFSPNGILGDVEAGTYLDLKEYVDKFAPNFKRRVEENERFQKGMKNMGDVIGYLPMLVDDPAYNAYNGYFIRQDWLEQVGMDIPETIEEWEKVLTAFRDNKLGDGKTVPFATIADGSMPYEIFASAFGLSNIVTTSRIDKDGNVTHNVLQPGYKEYLVTMNRWYKEGLIDPNFLAGSVKQCDSMMLNGELGSIYIDNNNDIPKYMSTNPDLNLVAVPYPKAADGSCVSPVGNADLSSLGFVITGGCEHPVEAMRFIDYLYSEEASDLLNWGIEGETYEVDADGNKHFTDYVLNNAEGKSPTEAFASKYFCRGAMWGVTQYSAMRGLEENFSEEIKKQREQSIQYSMKTNKELIVTSFVLTEEERDEISRKGTEVNTYITEMHQKFILGKEPLSNFDKFVENVKKMGLTDILKIYQGAYDRLNK